MLDRHILPALGDHYVDAISPQDVILWRDAQRAKESTVNSRLRVLRAMPRDAQADLGLPRDPCARETEEMFLHYSHIERGEKHSAVERALALVDGPKVEEKVEGSQPGDEARNASRHQTTRNG